MSVNNVLQIEETKESSESEKNEEKSDQDLIYGIDDIPNWPLSILFGFQQYFTMLGATIAVPLIIVKTICVEPDDPINGKFVCTIVFISGIVTLLQSTFGTRLPIIQGGSFSYLPPVFAIISTNYGQCSTIDFTILTDEEKAEVWQTRTREILGAIILASMLEIILSITGLIGILERFITPLVVVPTLVLIGLALHDAAAKNASGSWIIAILTAVIIGFFCQILNRKKVPIPSFSKKKGFYWKKFKLFGLFPILFGIFFSWGICGLLTISGALPEGHTARTDAKLKLVSNSPWIYIPYPFQFGLPTFTIGSALGMFAAVLSSMIESVGDYYACARICKVPKPPVSAINRGLTTEGLGCLIGGIFGVPNGTTSYSGNIGAIRITRVGSRRVIQAAGIIMICFGILGKFGAACATLPDPVLAGIFFILFPMIASIGLSNLQYIDLNSSRNLFVLGIPLFMGLMVPNYIKHNPGLIATGSKTLDQVLTVLLSTSMLIGGVLGVVLDNLLPGCDEERGISKWNEMAESEYEKQERVYNFPIGMDILKRYKIFSKFPISPTFQGFSGAKQK